MSSRNKRFCEMSYVKQKQEILRDELCQAETRDFAR